MRRRRCPYAKSDRINRVRRHERRSRDRLAALPHQGLDACFESAGARGDVGVVGGAPEGVAVEGGAQGGEPEGEGGEGGEVRGEVAGDENEADAGFGVEGLGHDAGCVWVG